MDIFRKVLEKNNNEMLESEKVELGFKNAVIQSESNTQNEFAQSELNCANAVIQSEANPNDEVANFEGGNALNQFIFPLSLLTTIQENYSVEHVDSQLLIRPLQLGDFYRGYLQLLSQLTVVGTVDFARFSSRFHSMATIRPLSYFILVIENNGQIVGSGTLVLEWKFIHEAGQRARIEDVVVSYDMRGRGLGKVLGSHLMALARHLNAYKLSLECVDSLVVFYEQFGFKRDVKNQFLVRRFDDI